MSESRTGRAPLEKSFLSALLAFAGLAWTGKVDAARLGGDDIFHDGFESGGVSAWSGLSPGILAVTHGMTVPVEHPRLWFDAERLARARTWFQNNPFTPPTNEDQAGGYGDVALHGLLSDNATGSCSTAIDWAAGKSRKSPPTKLPATRTWLFPARCRSCWDAGWNSFPTRPAGCWSAAPCWAARSSFAGWR